MVATKRNNCKGALAFTALAILVVSVAADELPDDAGSIFFAPEEVECKSFNYDCHGCVDNGCYWCPSDALCFKTPEYTVRAESDDKKEIEYLYPNRVHNCRTPESFTQTTCTAPENLFSDPVYSAQKWIFDEIKVESVWAKGYTGMGVRVRINDSGMEIDHPEFLGRVDLDASCPIYEPAESLLFGSNDASFHGNVVASLVGATADNDYCGVGVAPGVTFSSCNLFGTSDLAEDLQYKLEDIDISQNSWGEAGCRKKNRKLDFFCSTPDCNRRLQEEGISFCPFVHKPFESYNEFPCDHCDFRVAFQYSEQGEDCKMKMVNHCKAFPVQENKACMEIYDLILAGECHFGYISDGWLESVLRGVTEGRDGKGIIYVMSSGNGFVEGDDTNFQGFNTRYTIPVAAVSKTGNFSSYSTPGASIFVSAPGGDNSQAVTNVVAAAKNGACAQIASGHGTSYAAPIVSGVVALMLEANPDLGWRDVKYILALTAEEKKDKNDETVARNGAGIVHSNRYGFGIVNAEKAVETSERWTNIGPEQMLFQEGKGNIHIPDDPSKVTEIPLYFDHDSKFIAESVYLEIKLEHSSRGHLRIELVSPMGMTSVMAPGRRPEAQQSGWMKFTSVRHWGEDPDGTWTIKIVDTTPGYVNDCISYRDYGIDLLVFENRYVTLSCDFRAIDDLRNFCRDGDPFYIDQFMESCESYNYTVGDHCSRIEQVMNRKSAGMTAREACCECGGGFKPNMLPEEVLEWKVTIYGHEKMPGEGAFSGVEGSTELGKWGNRGRVYVEDRLRVP